MARVTPEKDEKWLPRELLPVRPRRRGTRRGILQERRHADAGQDVGVGAGTDPELLRRCAGQGLRTRHPPDRAPLVYHAAHPAVGEPDLGRRQILHLALRGGFRLSINEVGDMA